MPKPQRRFHKKFEIEGAINKYHREARSRMAMSEKIELEVKELVRQSNMDDKNPGQRQYLIESADDLRKKARKARRRAERIDEIYLPQLGRALADFQTETLFKGDDTAVVLTQ